MDWLEIKEFIKDASKAIIIIIFIIIILVYIVSITQVAGNSMNNTLMDGELLIVNKIKYKITEVKRGDIISLKQKDTKYLIKRVIGLPGDVITIQNNKVYINEEEYPENYLTPNLEYEDFNMQDIGYTKIPEDQYFVLGDNRSDSIDSRQVGLIPKSDIIGKISIRFWPIHKFSFL